MKRTIASLSALAIGWSAAADYAFAQFGTLGQPPQRVRPTVSPAINIGAGGAYSYYGYVKPQQDATRSIMNLQQTLNQMNPDGSLRGQLDYYQQQPQMQAPTPSQPNGQVGMQTGHAAAFFNYSHYYPTTPVGSSNALYGVAQTGFGFGLGGFGPTFIGAGPIGFGGPAVGVFYGDVFNRR